MADLIYSVIASLDGYIADERGSFDWAMPSEEVHAFISDLERPVGTYLYGRRMYEVMAAWETMGGPDEPPVVREYAEIWRAADKIVYSTTLEAVTTPRTRLERTFDPERVREAKASTDRDLSVGGPGLAVSALRAGLVDECRLFLTPILVGGGTPVFPPGVCLPLDLRDEHRFANGMAYLRYRVRPTAS